MTGSRAWGVIGNELASASGDDFARKVGPLLKVLWPGLTETPHRKEWDAAGIDYFTWADDGSFPCVVQCKGFVVRELGSSQQQQVLASIDKFSKSGHRCDQYVLVHNRDGRNRDFASAIDAALDGLVANGHARRAVLFHRQTFLTEVRRALSTWLGDALRAATARRAQRLAHLFEVTSDDYLTVVPATRGTITLAPLQPLTRETGHTGRYPVADAILGNGARTWTLVEGRFGIGKTTATLVAAQASAKTVVIVPCVDIEFGVSRSLRQLLEAAIANLPLEPATLDEVDRSIIDELAGAELVALLSGGPTENEYVLVFDGLDENRLFATSEGLTRLFNQLVTITCPVVLTTRTEHFDALCGTYSVALGELSQRLGARPTISWWKLDSWAPSDAVVVVRQASKQVDTAAQQRLNSLSTMLQDGSYRELFGDLPSNPLMLKFLIDDVAAGHLGGRTVATLLAAWVRKKLWRDMERHATLLNGHRDIGLLVENMVQLMERAALRMTTPGVGGEHELVEHIESAVVLDLARATFGASGDSLVGIVVNSMLVPAEPRRGQDTRLAFALRVFHEFFLASALRREGVSPGQYPAAVARLWDELLPVST